MPLTATPWERTRMNELMASVTVHDGRLNTTGMLWINALICIQAIADISHTAAEKAIEKTSNATRQWLAERSSCQGWLGRAPGVSLWYVVVLLTSVTALGDCHTIEALIFPMRVSVFTRCQIGRWSVMGRSQQNSSTGSYSCSGFYFLIIFHNKPVSERNRLA